MAENGIEELSQVLNVSLEGSKFAVELTKESVELLKRFLLILLNAGKGTKKGIDWLRFHKTMGKTNKSNLIARSGGNLQAMAMTKEDFKTLQPMLKKSGVLYTVAPMFKGAKDKSVVHFMFATVDAARVQQAMEWVKQQAVDEAVKKGRNREEASKEWDSKNSPETMTEMMNNIGANCPPEEFHSQMKEKFGDDYMDVFQKVNISKNGKSTISEQELLDELARKIAKSENKNVEMVRFTFEDDRNNPEKSHIVAQTETHIKVQINENEKICVWLKKDDIEPPLDKPCKGGKRTAKMPADSELFIHDIEGKEEKLTINAKEFVERVERSERKANEDVLNSVKKKTMDNNRKNGLKKNSKSRTR